MFPISDVIPSRTVPVATIALIACNAVAFVFEFTRSEAALQELVRSWGVVPSALSWPSILTSQFLHAGWLHVAGNMLYLWIFGDNVEDRLGHVRYVLFYLSCGTVSALAQVAMNPHSAVPMVGASGAIAGVMGAYFVLFPLSRVLTAVFVVLYLDIIEVPAIFFLGIWFLLQLFSGVGSLGAEVADGGVAFWAHIGGFGAGVAVGLLQRAADVTRPRSREYRY
ncbi:MAG TPA: rhomboid family intramembrane serine protease [Vicinamibacterales bacterium]|nr:rhomboid family intramembrane serine protease [Vicinamibacterales bacterium]